MAGGGNYKGHEFLIMQIDFMVQSILRQVRRKQWLFERNINLKKGNN